MGLINKEKLMQAMYHRAFETDGDTMWQSGCWVRYRAIEDVIKSQPAQPEHKKGKWLWKLADNGWADHICSECGWKKNTDIHVSLGYNFCPSCGADMRGELE